MGQRLPDAIERAALGPVTSEPEADQHSHVPDAQGEMSLPGGDTLRQIDGSGNPVLQSNPAEAAQSSSDKGKDGSQGEMPTVTEEMIRQGQAANTARSQEISRERQAIAEERALLNTERQSLFDKSQSAQEPSRTPLTFTEQLESDRPGTLATMEPIALDVLNSLGKVIDGKHQPLHEEVQELKQQLSAVSQKQDLSAEQQRVRGLTDETKELVSMYGVETVTRFAPQMQAKRQEVQGLGIKDAFQLVAGSQLQEAAVQVAVQKTLNEQQRHKEASVFEGGPSPSASPVPTAIPGESAAQTAERLYPGMMP